MLDLVVFTAGAVISCRCDRCGVLSHPILAATLRGQFVFTVFQLFYFLNLKYTSNAFLHICQYWYQQNFRWLTRDNHFQHNFFLFFVYFNRSQISILCRHYYADYVIITLMTSFWRQYMLRVPVGLCSYLIKFINSQNDQILAVCAQMLLTTL